jgi:hypothetical protein
MTTQHSATADETLCLIVTDRNRGMFAEGPMTDDKHWQDAAREARNRQPRIIYRQTGPDRNALAAAYRSEQPQLAGVPPGSIVRQRRMNDPAFIAKVVSGVGERNSGRPCFPMKCRFLGRCHGGDGTQSIAVARGLRLIALSPHSPVPAVTGGQTLGDQMVACAAASGDQGCGQNVFGLAPGLLKQRILPTVPPRGLTRGRDR